MTCMLFSSVGWRLNETVNLLRNNTLEDLVDTSQRRIKNTERYLCKLGPCKLKLRFRCLRIASLTFLSTREDKDHREMEPWLATSVV